MKTAVWRVPGLVSAGGGNLKSNYICEDIPQSLMGFGDGEQWAFFKYTTVYKSTLYLFVLY